MCDSATMNVLEDIVTRRVNLGNAWLVATDGSALHEDATFTAFDISMEAKKDHGVSLRHREMKNDIHALFEQGRMPGYDRTAVDVRPGVPKAFVYYPNGSDPTTYKSRWVDQSNAQVVQVTATQNQMPLLTTSSVMPAAPVKKGAHDVDQRQRLTVPNDLVEALGAKPNDWLYAYPETDQVVVKAAHEPHLEPYHYRVDKSGNIRISQICLQEGGIGGQSYDTIRINDTIVVKLP